jgi:hypothetical protein
VEVTKGTDVVEYLNKVDNMIVVPNIAVVANLATVDGTVETERLFRFSVDNRDDWVIKLLLVVYMPVDILLEIVVDNSDIGVL